MILLPEALGILLDGFPFLLCCDILRGLLLSLDVSLDGFHLLLVSLNLLGSLRSADDAKRRKHLVVLVGCATIQVERPFNFFFDVREVLEQGERRNKR